MKDWGKNQSVPIYAFKIRLALIEARVIIEIVPHIHDCPSFLAYDISDFLSVAEEQITRWFNLDVKVKAQHLIGMTDKIRRAHRRKKEHGMNENGSRNTESAIKKAV